MGRTTSGLRASAAGRAGRLRWAAAVAALAVALGACGAAPAPGGSAGQVTPPSPTPVMVITQADGGHSVHLAQGQVAALQLASGYDWSPPQASTDAVRIDRTGGAGAEAPAWSIAAVHPGTAIVRSEGRPACQPGAVCPAFVLAFQVTVIVS